MDLNFDRLRKIYLEQGDKGLYEEKLRMLEAYLNSLPEDKMERANELNKKIEAELHGLTPEQRIKKISQLMQESLLDLTDAMADLGYVVIQGTSIDQAKKAIDNAKQK